MPPACMIHTYDKDVEAVWNANIEEGVKVAKAAGAANPTYTIFAPSRSGPSTWRRIGRCGGLNPAAERADSGLGVVTRREGSAWHKRCAGSPA